MQKEENSQDKALKKDFNAGIELRRENSRAISELTGRDPKGISRRLNGKFSGRGEDDE